MSKDTIVIVNGYPSSGKDTFVEFVTEELKMHGFNVGNQSSIRPVWDMLKQAGIHMDIKTAAERNLAAVIKSELNKYNRWADRMTIDAMREWFFKDEHCGIDSKNLLFVHVREPESIDFLKANKPQKTFTLFIDRPSAERKMGNAADENVEQYVYDKRITNGGSLNDLEAQAVVYAQQFL